MPRTSLPTHTTMPALSTRSLCRLVALLLAVGLVFGASTAFAQSTVNVRVEVIVASDTDGGVDASLRAHAAHLTRQFPSFRRFLSSGSHRASLANGASQSFALPGGGTVTLRSLGATNGRHKLQIDVPGGSTTVDAAPGGRLFVGGPRAPNGTVILMILVD